MQLTNSESKLRDESVAAFFVGTGAGFLCQVPEWLWLGGTPFFGGALGCLEGGVALLACYLVVRLAVHSLRLMAVGATGQACDWMEARARSVPAARLGWPGHDTDLVPMPPPPGRGDEIAAAPEPSPGG